jgi:hypothetical protein
MLFVLALLVLCVLAPRYGADSRIHDERDGRRWSPGPR